MTYQSRHKPILTTGGTREQKETAESCDGEKGETRLIGEEDLTKIGIEGKTGTSAKAKSVPMGKKKKNQDGKTKNKTRNQMWGNRISVKKRRGGE